MKSVFEQHAQDVDVKAATLKAAGGTAGVVLYGITLSEWVAIFTIIYLSLQIYTLCPKAYMLSRDIIVHMVRRVRKWFK